MIGVGQDGTVTGVVKLTRGGGSMLGRALGGSRGGESTAAVLAKVQASMKLPFSLVTQVAVPSDPGVAPSNLEEGEDVAGQAAVPAGADEVNKSSPAAGVNTLNAHPPTNIH
jgi:hypothetical protein